ncbi:hypothetical protein EFY87_02255 [Flexivirga caeni]|uniref:Uncharacterized protein n=1 Tax=Flexivirga caeni TaxID=2294115 RepID=A0A3M9MIQ5_9MICO|nr:hypothetical protein EFY87_02255 [Flexivirga caeni]
MQQLLVRVLARHERHRLVVDEANQPAVPLLQLRDVRDFVGHGLRIVLLRWGHLPGGAVGADAQMEDRAVRSHPHHPDRAARLSAVRAAARRTDQRPVDADARRRNHLLVVQPAGLGTRCARPHAEHERRACREVVIRLGHLGASSFLVAVQLPGGAARACSSSYRPSLTRSAADPAIEKAGETAS